MIKEMEEIWVKMPGFRFHPTEEELLSFYLKNMVCGGMGMGMRWSDEVIGFLNIYNHEPWDLPGLASIGEREWYFYVPRDTKTHINGGRPNRTTKSGFWKATGSDRKLFSLSKPNNTHIGLKKTLVFYLGKAPRGSRTDWVMNEYRLPGPLQRQHLVLCKVYRKATSLRVLEQRAAVEQQPAQDELLQQQQFEQGAEENIEQGDILLLRKNHDDDVAAADAYHHHHHHHPPPPLSSSPSTASTTTSSTISFSFCSSHQHHCIMLKEDEKLHLPPLLSHHQTTANQIMPLDDLPVAYKFSIDWPDQPHQDSLWPHFSTP